MNNTDLRIIKTKRAIQGAFIDLLEQKNYEDINVQDIVTAALVNRTTFYRHYASKSELADEMIQSFKAYYAERLAGRYSHEQPMAFFRQHFPEFYARRREMMGNVLSDAGYEFQMPKGAFYFFPKAPGGDDVAFVNKLLDERILAVPGSGFGGPGHFRLAFCVEDEVIARSAEGFKRARG